MKVSILFYLQISDIYSHVLMFPHILFIVIMVLCLHFVHKLGSNTRLC